MGINNTLLRGIDSNLYDYGCSYEEINEFLFNYNNFIQRQGKAIQIVDNIMTMHGKQELLSYVSELARVEHGIQELQPWVRDHVVHALMSYLLGIYINEKFLSINLNKIRVSRFQWKLAGLFHDVGYPVQIARDILSPFTAKVNEIRERLGANALDIAINVVPVGFENLQNNNNSFNLIQQWLNQWNLSIDARFEFNEMVQSGRICHGIISSLAVLNVIDLMYQNKNPLREYTDTYSNNTNINWNQVNFENEVVPACAAIFIHNLPTDRFNQSRIDPSIAPLPYLLKLTDTLQEWERPSLTNNFGFSENDFEINIDNQGNLIFKVNNKNTRNIIQGEIDRTLFLEKIVIQ